MNEEKSTTEIVCRFSERRSLTVEKYGQLLSTMEALFLNWDPMGISSSGRLNEYEAEVCSILPRLEAEAKTLDDVIRILIEEFTFWFWASLVEDNRWAIEELAIQMWRLWTEYSNMKTST